MKKILILLFLLLFLVSSCSIMSATNNSKKSSLFKVTYVDNLGNVLSVQKVKDIDELKEVTAPYIEGYQFVGFYPEITSLTEDTVFVAKYDYVKDLYKVEFDLDGGVLESGKTIQYLKEGEMPDIPKFSKDMYEFASFDKEIVEVSEDVCYKAIYKKLTINRIDPKEFVKNITFGWNYYDVLEENFNNPKILDLLKEKNINTVQLPIIWPAFCNSEYSIKEEYLVKLKEFVDLAVSNNFYVVITCYDFYDYMWSSLELANMDNIDRIMKLQWGCLAEIFRDYDEHVIFSYLNEPRDYRINDNTNDSRYLLNECNKNYVEFIRSTGGNNLYRQIILTTGWGKYAGDDLEAFEFPDDDYLILGIHAYCPFEFVHAEDNLHDSFMEKETEYKEEIYSVFEALYNYEQKNDCAILLTEFGSRFKDNDDQRELWLRYYVSCAYSFGIKCFVWDVSNWATYREFSFALIDKDNLKWIHPDVTDAIEDLIKNENYIPFFKELNTEYVKLNGKIVLPDYVTDSITLKKYPAIWTYDTNDIVNKEDGLYVVAYKNQSIKLTVNGYDYFKKVNVLYDFADIKTGFTIDVKFNGDGLLQCYPKGVGESTARLDYDWFSYNTDIVTISKYSTIFIVSDGKAVIKAVSHVTGNVGFVEIEIENGKFKSYRIIIQD